jgi:hypothetical protein
VVEQTIETPNPISPKTSLPYDLGVEPNSVTDDVDTLINSYSLFLVDEASSGEKDYSLKYHRTPDFSTVFSDASIASNRERDRVWLQFKGPSVEVYLDGQTEMSLFLSLYSSSEELIAFCNGIIFEVAGEAFYVPGESSDLCDSHRSDQYTFDYRFFYFGEKQGTGYTDAVNLDEEDPDLTRMFQLLSQNPFVVRIVDTNSKEHVFSCDLSGEFPTPQDLMRFAYEAEKAVKLGFGY